MNKKTLNMFIALSLIVLAVILRILPHPANFAPVAAIAIFGGAVLPRRQAVMVPLLAMMVSDFFIGLHSLIPLTWGCYALFALASSRWLAKPALKTGAALTMGASLTFFIVTNFGVWLTSGMYQHSWAGFVRCYEMALPFFRNTAASDLIYAAGLFGAYFVASYLSRSLVKPAKNIAD